MQLRQNITIIVTVLVQSLFISEAAVADEQLPTIAIILDDMGNHRKMGDRAIAIPAPLTLAFLPFRRHTKEQARRAYAAGKEVMLHAPMENQNNLPLGAAALTGDMSQSEMIHIFRNALEAIPYLSGVNNHMGSRLTQKRKPMVWLMEELREHPLYFVDSRTTPLSVAEKTAVQYDIPALARDVFLDNATSEKAIDAQFKQLILKAKENGTAIAIGHPYPETIKYLERELPKLGQQGIAIATIKGIWSIRNQGSTMFDSRGKTTKQILALHRQCKKKTLCSTKDTNSDC